MPASEVRCLDNPALYGTVMVNPDGSTIGTPAGASSSSAAVRQVTAVLTHAQILALPTTRVVLAPPLGATQFYVPVQACFFAHLVTPYTIPANSYIQTGGYQGIWLDLVLNNSTDGWTLLTQLLGTAQPNGNRGIFSRGQQSYSPTMFTTTWAGAPLETGGPAPALNQPLVVAGYASGSFAGGDPGNTLTVTVQYQAFDVSTSRFV